MIKLKSLLLSGIHPVYRSLVLKSFFLLVCISLFRVFDFISLISKGVLDRFDLWLLFKGVNYDLNSILLGLTFLLPIFILLKFISEKALNIGMIIYNGVILFSTICLSYYYFINKELLGANVFSYSLSELIFISSQEFYDPEWTYIIGGILAFTLLIFGLKKIAFESTFKGDWLLVLLAVIVSIINICQLKYSAPVSREYDSFVEFRIAHCKADYVVRDFIQSIDFSYNEEETLAISKRYVSVDDIKPFEIEFPFLKKRSKKNVLGPYFEKREEKPNVVVIIVEGLSRVFSGPDALYKFTPFLDSLVDKSLYWKNFMSNCQRTFGAPANILGSLPYGVEKRGFNKLKPYPSHKTILSMLKQEGYDTEFYYPAWSGFDDYKGFFFEQDITTINDNVGMYPEDIDVVEWGRTDRDMFEFYKSDLKTKKSPFMDVLLTLSIHTPFDHPEKKYFKRAKTICDKEYANKGFVDKEIDLFATVLYLDDCMKDMMTSFKKSKHYANTIFVITGDHNVQFLPLRNELDRFYVPLYVFSPLLKETGVKAGVSAHLNITPSLVELLDGNFGIKFPEKTSFVGDVLDTSSTFQSINRFPVSVYSNSLVQYIYKDKALIGEKEFTILDGLKMVPSNTMTKELNQMKEDYKHLDKYVCKRNKLLKN